MMKKNSNTKRKLSLFSTLIVIFTMITSLFGTSASSVQAMSSVTASDAVANYNILTNANESHEVGSLIYYKIDYASLPSLSDGTHSEKISVKLPSNMSTTTDIKYDDRHFTLEQVDNFITFTYRDDILDQSVLKFSGQILIFGKTLTIGSSTYDVKVNDKSSLKGTLQVVSSAAKNPIGKYTSNGVPTRENNIPKYMLQDNLASIRYSIEVNAVAMERANLVLKDVLPKGLKLNASSFYITEVGGPNSGRDVTSQFQRTISGNSFSILFGPSITQTYMVFYTADVVDSTVEEFENIATQEYDNGGTRQKDTAINYTKYLRHEKGTIVYRNTRTLRIKKLDAETNAPLEGAKFSISSNRTEVTATTNADGIAVVSNLDPNEYSVKEIEAPAGYELNPTAQTVIIQKVDAEVTFLNEKAKPKKGKIKIVKQDAASNTALENAEFKVTDTTGTTVATLVTNNLGEAEIELPIGTYSVVETKAPAGYVLNVTSQNATVVNGETQTLTFLNNKESGKIKIVKQDTVSKRPLANAEFAVKNATGEIVATMVTNNDGEAEIELPIGTYSVVETKAPSGYILNATGQDVTIENATNQTLTFLNTQEKGKIKIEKRDSVTNEVLAGAEFAVKNTTGEIVATMITSAKGEAEVELPVGTYSVVETKAPAGYVLNEAAQTATVSNASSHTFVFQNDKSKGKIRIEKYDGANLSKLPGAEFTITDYLTKKVVGTIITGAEGFGEIELPIGQYEITETKAPIGYVLDSVPAIVSVFNNETDLLAFINHKQEAEKGKIKIKKQDSITGLVLAQAEFDVLDADGNTVAQLITNEFGEAMVELPVGVYTIKETKAPAGYVLSSDTQSTTVINNSESTLTFLNTKEQPSKGRITVRKYESKNGYPLLGAEFSVTDTQTGEIVATLTTNTFGEASIELPAGSYTVIETKAPVGYILSAIPQTLTLEKDDRIGIAFMNNKEAAKGKVKVKKYESICGYALAGAEFAVIDANVKTVATLVTNTFGEAEVELPEGTYSVVETKAPAGYVLNSTPKSLKVTQACIASATFYNDKSTVGNGKIVITKVDACTGAPLYGAEFAVIDASGKTVATMVTDRYGEASVVVPTGTYTVKETKAPTGYILDTTGKTVTVTKDGCVSLRFCNFQSPVQNGKIFITKVDACTGAPLYGAEFAVIDASGKTIATMTSNHYGEASVVVPTGTYTVKETKAPTGYILDTTGKTVTVTKDGCVSLRFCNFQIPVVSTGKIYITKVDACTGKPLYGAEFAVIDSSGKTVTTMTTNQYGEAAVVVPTGTYTVKETKAPTGYVLDTTGKTVTVTKDGCISLRFCNFQTPVGNGKIFITKVDACTGAPLYGAVFAVIDANGKTVATMTSNQFGEASVVVPVGTYTVKETKAPTGYILDSSTKTVVITKDKCVSLRFCNYQSAPATGKVRIVKYDSTGCKLLAGAEFTVVDLTTGKTVAVLTTNNCGEIVKDLPVGKYRISETKAPVGYLIDCSPATITIEKDRTIQLVSYNEKSRTCYSQYQYC